MMKKRRYINYRQKFTFFISAYSIVIRMLLSADRQQTVSALHCLLKHWTSNVNSVLKWKYNTVDLKSCKHDNLTTFRND